MKLIDLLVQELPKRGGWPEGVAAITQDSIMAVNGYKSTASLLINEEGTWIWTNQWGGYIIEAKNSPALTEDYTVTIITREQYLAASQQSVWDGEGLPPVGCECDGLYDTDEDQWFKVRIIAHDNDAIIGRWLDGLGEGALFDYDGPSSFRPIRTEAERKREETITAIFNWADETFDLSNEMDRSICTLLHDAIAAGKVPGVTLL